VSGAVNYPTATRTPWPLPTPTTVGSPLVSPPRQPLPASPHYSVAAALQSPLSPRNIARSIIENNPDLAKLRQSTDDKQLRAELARPDISLSGAFVHFGSENNARLRAVAAQRNLALAQYFSKRDELVKEALGLLLQGASNNAEQKEKQALLKVYDKEMAVLRVQRRDGVITDAPLLALEQERSKVKKALSGLQAAEQKITQDLAVVMGVDAADIEKAAWPSLPRRGLKNPARNSSVAERVRAEIENLPGLRPYLIVRPDNKSPRLTSVSDITAYYNRESGMENLVSLKKGGFFPRQPGHNLSYGQLSDLTRRVDAPRQALLLERLIVTRPNRKFIGQLAQAFPKLWEQARTGSATTNTLLASAGSALPIGSFTPSRGSGTVDSSQFVRLLVDEARKNPLVMGELVKRVPIAVTTGGVASIRHLKPDELSNVDQAAIEKRLAWLFENGKGGSPAALHSAFILLAFAQLEVVKRTGQGIKLGLDLKQVATALLPGGAPLAFADLLLKAFNPNLGRNKANRIAGAEAIQNLNHVILTALAAGERGLSQIRGAVAPITYDGTSHQRFRDLRTQAEAAAKIHGTMKLEVSSGLLPEVRQRSDYNGMNLFEAERKKIEAYGELVRAGLEPQSVLSQLLNVHGLTGQISQKTLQYFESNLVFP
jgi:hypothetical protein